MRLVVDVVILKLCADHLHLSSVTSSTYAKDADHMYVMHRRKPKAINQVSPWYMIRIESSGNAEIMTQIGGSQIISIKELPEYFVQECLGITNNQSVLQNPKGPDRKGSYLC